MNTAYVVKKGNTFLYNGEDGDIGLGPELAEAKRFLSRDEAVKAANQYDAASFEVVAVDVAES